MARYKSYSYAQGKFIPVYFEKQILPGTFEYSLNHLVDHELDLSIFDERYRNEETGASAYDPRILLKIILFAYSRGITTSRRIAQACEENIIFMALSCDTKPHFTTIADFVSTMDKEITRLFREVLLVCDDLGLIGKEMFAIDGCKLPSNASKEWSGTKADFEKKASKMERAIENILKKHRELEQRISPLTRTCDIASALPASAYTVAARMRKLVGLRGRKQPAFPVSFGQNVYGIRRKQLFVKRLTLPAVPGKGPPLRIG